MNHQLLLNRSVLSLSLPPLYNICLRSFASNGGSKLVEFTLVKINQSTNYVSLIKAHFIASHMSYFVQMVISTSLSSPVAL